MRWSSVVSPSGSVSAPAIEAESRVARRAAETMDGTLTLPQLTEKSVRIKLIITNQTPPSVVMSHFPPLSGEKCDISSATSALEGYEALLGEFDHGEGGAL